MTAYLLFRLPQMLRRLPLPIVVMLDAWSRGVARKRADARRRRAAELAGGK